MTERQKREWLDRHTFYCEALHLRLTPDECRALRNRPVAAFTFDVPLRPLPCGRCLDWQRAEPGGVVLSSSRAFEGPRRTGRRLKRLEAPPTSPEVLLARALSMAEWDERRRTSLDELVRVYNLWAEVCEEPRYPEDSIVQMIRDRGGSVPLRRFVCKGERGRCVCANDRLDRWVAYVQLRCTTQEDTRHEEV